MSGGVKRYLSEKVRYLEEAGAPNDEHILIVPGARDEVIAAGRSRTYTIRSPLISRTSQYRVLLRLTRIEEIIACEQPHLIECGDPYQVGWKAAQTGAALRIPVVGFYHSHFPEAYLRTAQRFLGRRATEIAIELSRRYIRALYSRFARTLVPSPALGSLLRSWGVANVLSTDLGVDTRVFQPQTRPGEDVRRSLQVSPEHVLLLYVGRLAQEKNTHTLFEAFRLLPSGRFHLHVVGDGLQRAELHKLQAEVNDHFAGSARVTWLPYCADSEQLAAVFRAGDLFVHPGVQETFGLVALEAQACGTPVVGIRGSYMDRIIFTDQSFWARENTARALAGAIEAASGLYLRTDPHALHNRVAAQFSWPQVFSRLFTIYREIIEAHPAR